jgi:dolichol-phosphate mannosyltransferase
MRSTPPVPAASPDVLAPPGGLEVPRIGVVIPAYRAASSICGVLGTLGPGVERIYVVDDGCPEGSGDAVRAGCTDPRVMVLDNETNLGVGAATVRGYRQALADGMQIVVKMDADGQMDAAMLPRLVAPLLRRTADYTKGNRFSTRYCAWSGTRRRMPKVRLIANSLLSFLHKAMSGYWDIVDPTNGFTAIRRAALENIDLDDVAPRYFFENDMLFHLNLVGAVVLDVPMVAIYGTEKSQARARQIAAEFPRMLLKRTIQRIVIRYFINDFNIASLQLLIGLPLFGLGVLFGVYCWILSMGGTPNTPGTVMLSALPIILGFQLLLSAAGYDVANIPRNPLCGEEGGAEPGLPELAA